MDVTILGNSTPYCSATIALYYIDTRQWGDALYDNGTRATAAQIIADPTMAELLLSASGEIEMAAVRGARYLPVDLATLAASATASAATLRKMTAWLAFTDAWMRRRPADQVPQMGVWAYQLLDALGKGEKIFSIQENIEADIPLNGFETSADDWTRASSVYLSLPFWGRRAFTLRPGYWSGGGYSGGCGCGDYGG